MSLILISILVLGLAIFFMNFNVIFRKDGAFPETEVGHNREMAKRGLRCAKGEERALWSKKERGGCSSGGSCCCGGN